MPVNMGEKVTAHLDKRQKSITLSGFHEVALKGSVRKRRVVIWPQLFTIT